MISGGYETSLLLELLAMVNATYELQTNGTVRSKSLNFYAEESTLPLQFRSSSYLTIMHF